eukprot:TRINITY_DN4415_c0_g1_i2.p1 TRINITY_DN4415_c0_g1~~TRINITY_DN4415_c0_g1_i2.p1  ORF type:complete len:870 (+),score=126.35 TRINITY_DN4415_c0_g1_i2:136-2745(+)
MSRAPTQDFKFILTTDISQKVRLKICSFSGRRTPLSAATALDTYVNDPFLQFSGLYHTAASSRDYNNNNGGGVAATTTTSLTSMRGRGGQAGSDLFVSCALYADGVPLCLPELTRYKVFHSDEEYKWDELVTLPLKYSELPIHTLVVMTVWDVFAPRRAVAVGGTSFAIFGKNSIMRKGRQKLVLWEGREGDGARASSTPGKAPKLKEVDRLEKLQKRHDRGLIDRVEWLDAPARAQMQSIASQERDKSPHTLFLVVDLPEFEYPVLFREIKYQLQSTALPAPTANKIVLVHDCELNKENPAELKYLKLMRSNKARNQIDRDLKPGSKEREQIAIILRHPPTKHLTDKEKEIIWRFRYYLSQDTKALAKFLQCVDFNDAGDSKQASELMHKWAPIGMDDALELLSANFQDEGVRMYAVERLRSADDEELKYYMLQLVQAMKYDASMTGGEQSPNNSPLITFMLARAAANFQLGCYIYWYLIVESKLVSSKYAPFYKKVLITYREELERTTKNEFSEQLNRQDWLVGRLSALSLYLKSLKTDRVGRIEKMRQLLSAGDNSEFGDLANFPSMPLPLHPDLEVTGIIYESAYIFKSAKAPLSLRFRTTSGPSPYGLIFKTGDDLRQDQLIIQLISLMDRLLKKENLDLKLTPYKVLATAEEDGMVELVTPSESLASVIKQYDGDIRKFLQKHNPDEHGPGGINAEALDTFVKSCAGYCVITYILGIGDRHLDNLMLTTKGNLFHIDFGYILGNDPKPLPPPMKLCKEMVEGMGGANSKFYLQFKQLCCEAYNILRKSANLILNLFSLMVDANIPDISTDPEKSLLKIQEKFRLELSDEEASQTLLMLLNESINALFPLFTEAAHRWAQYWRS